MKIENDFLNKIPSTVRERAVLADGEYADMAILFRAKYLDQSGHL